MKILFSDIPRDGLKWQGSLTLNQERLKDECQSPASAEVSVEIYPIKNYFAMKGKMHGTVTVQCSRCLGDFDHDYEISFNIYLVREPLSGKNEEVELKEEDMDFSYNHGEGLELNTVFTEQLLLSLPMKKLCRENCAGLCASCGKNLNTETCQCDQDKSGIDPRLAALSDIKKKYKH